jgi:ribosomal protein S4E
MHWIEQRVRATCTASASSPQFNFHAGRLFFADEDFANVNQTIYIETAAGSAQEMSR